MSSPVAVGSVRCGCGRLYQNPLAVALCTRYSHNVLGSPDPDAEFTDTETSTGRVRPADWPASTDGVELSEYVHPDSHIRETRLAWDQGFAAGVKRGELRLVIWGALVGGGLGTLFGFFAREVHQWIR